MDSVIELQRQTHEEVERLEMALASILSQQTNQVRQIFIVVVELALKALYFTSIT